MKGEKRINVARGEGGMSEKHNVALLGRDLADFRILQRRQISTW